MDSLSLFIEQIKFYIYIFWMIRENKTKTLASEFVSEGQKTSVLIKS